MIYPRILATADDGRRVLVALDDTQGYILDREMRRRYPPRLLLTLQAYVDDWQPYDGPQDSLHVWLANVEDVSGEKVTADHGR